MYRIITPDGQIFPVHTEWKDHIGLRLIIRDHPRSAGWTARTLRTAKEVTIEGIWKYELNTSRERNTVSDLRVRRPGRKANGGVYVTVPSLASPSLKRLATHENN